MACHARETVQVPRNVSNLMLRVNRYRFDHNVRKPYRINDPAKRVRRHAQEAGMQRDEIARLLCSAVHLNTVGNTVYTERAASSGANMENTGFEPVTC